MKLPPRIVAASLALLTAPLALATGATLDRPALLKRVVGNTIRYAAPGEVVHEFLAPDGIIHGRSSVHGTYLAHWRLLDDDLICFEHADPMQSGCVAVVLKGASIEYHRRDGVVEGPFDFLPGNPERL
jgi:hypothetical protein